MKKVKMYKYIGKNGTITSPVLLEGIQHIDLVELRAAAGYVLTNGEIKRLSITIPADEVDGWYEIKGTIE